MKNDHLVNIRRALQEKEIDLYLLPRTDSHSSEYIADYFDIIKWLTKFSGSNAFAVIGKDVSDVWTDGRYFLQAESELKESGFSLKKILPEKKQTFKNWFKEYLSNHEVKSIALAPSLFSISSLKEIIKITKANSAKITFDEDLITSYWKDRPDFPNADVTWHKDEYSGEATGRKLKRILVKLKENKASNYFTGALDEIAWVLNLRGADIKFNPVFYSNLFLSKNEQILFVDSKKLDKSAKNELEKNNVTIKPYEEYYNFCSNFKETAFLDSKTSNYKTYDSLKDKKLIKSIIYEEKAKKNSVQIENLKKALALDSLALFKFFVWIKQEIKSKEVTEYDALKKLSDFRGQNENYIGDSFYSIVGYKENGAIIHYAPKEKTSKIISRDGMLLVDSGGQYLNGTTDITRTISLGEPTREQIKNYTLVLKGHIALANAVFLSGTSGNQIDVLARQHLLAEGLNYQHGTGHGVGYYLNVHEGPQSISPAKTEAGNAPLIPGMLISNEPGYYKEGEYGIRLENLILVKEIKENHFGKFLGFETLTLFPFDRKLIDKDMLNKSEISWIDNYHAKVTNSLHSHLSSDEAQLLEKDCQAL